MLVIRRSRGRDGKIPGHSLVVIADGRPEHPSLRINEVCKKRIAVIRLGQEVSAECGLGISLENWHIDLAPVDHDKGLVVGDEFGKKRHDKQD